MIPNSLKRSRKSRRHRHRSYGRKVAESFGLVFGTPFLLFAILAFSVQAVEHESIPMPEFNGPSRVASELSTPAQDALRPLPTLRLAKDH